MIKFRDRILSLIWLAMVLLPVRMAAAQPGEQFPGLKASGLETVYVRDSSGAEVKGKLLQLGPDSVLLLENGVEHRFAIDEVERIQKRDSLRNGTIIGAVIGGAMGVLAAGFADCPSSQGHARECDAFRATTVALSIGVYAGLGTGIDALIPGRTTLYRKPDQSVVRVAPAGSGGIGLHMSVGW